MGLLDTFVAKPLEVQLPLRDTRKARAKRTDSVYPILLPHEILSTIYAQNRKEFDTFIVGPGDLNEFLESSARG